MRDRSGPRVAVLGGGILGVATARELARRHVRVELFTNAALGSGASGRSLSWLNSAAVRSPSYHRLRLLGMGRYRSLVGTDGAARYLRFDGGLRWATGTALGSLEAACTHLQDQGYASEWLTPEQVQARVPGVDPAAVPPAGALWHRDEGWVDLPLLIDVLARELTEDGGGIVAGGGPARIEVRGGRVTAVADAAGHRREVDAAVLAMGADVPGTLAGLGLTIPDATSIALLVCTEPVATPLKAVLNTPHVALRPTPDGCLVMDSGWSADSVLAHEDGRYTVPDAVTRRLLDEASAVLQGRPTLAAARVLAGPKPVPGDGEPVLGRVAAVGGLHVAFTHSGATVGLIVGELLAEEVCGATDPLLAEFSPARFAGS